MSVFLICSQQESNLTDSVQVVDIFTHKLAKYLPTFSIPREDARFKIILYGRVILISNGCG